MPPRGLYFDYEPVYEVVQDEWYGWPDYYSGIPITDARFGVKESDRKFVLTDATHRKLLKGKAQPRQPVALLPVHRRPRVWFSGTRSLAYRPRIYW